MDQDVIRNSKMGKKSIAFIILGLSIFILFMYFIFRASNTVSSIPTSYSPQDELRPQINIKKSLYDFGSMRVADKKSYDFIVGNVGKQPLQLSNITTSCNCTFVKVIYEGKESPEFNMHSKGSYIAEIDSGKKAILRVTYKPYIMPVYGFIEREAYVKTNDPLNPDLVLKVTATVK